AAAERRELPAARRGAGRGRGSAVLHALHPVANRYRGALGGGPGVGCGMGRARGAGAARAVRQGDAVRAQAAGLRRLPERAEAARRVPRGALTWPRFATSTAAR